MMRALRDWLQGDATERSGDLLDQPLLHLTDGDAWTVRDAASGCVVFGAPGSGKSSGPAACIIQAYLDAGFGGLVLCAKPGEADRWWQYAQVAGRTAHFVRFSPEQPELRINPLDHELKRGGRGGGYIQNAVTLFTQLLEILEGSERQGGGSDPFWQRAVLELLTAATDVLQLSGETVSLPAIYRIVQSLPRRDDEIDESDDEAWQEQSFAFQCLARAYDRDLDPGRREDLILAADHLLDELPRLPNRTRGSVTATLKGMAMPFLRSPLREVFGTDTTIRFEDCWERGQILVIDYPIREFGDVGRIVNVLMKTLFMQAVERRQVNTNSRPVFLVADECQEFVTSYDARFLATARSARALTLYLTQNISNLYAAVKSVNAKAVVDSLLANFATKIFCANADGVTNQWAAELIAQSWQIQGQSSVSTGHNTQFGSSTSQTLAFQVLPAEFTTLLKGGPPDWMVETILFEGGRVFEKGQQTFLRVLFPQTL